MFKFIPKSDISRRNFKSYKEWTQTHSDYPTIIIHEEDSAFDTETSETSSGYFIHPTYRSIQSKYYSNGGDLTRLFGYLNPEHDFDEVRNLSETASVITIPQIHYGEGLKPNSVSLLNTLTSASYYDDGWGNLILESTGSLVSSGYSFLVGTSTTGCYQISASDMQIISGNEYTVEFYADFTMSGSEGMQFPILYDTGSLILNGVANNNGIGVIQTPVDGEIRYLYPFAYSSEISPLLSVSFSATSDGYLRNMIEIPQSYTSSAPTVAIEPEFYPDTDPNNIICLTLNLVADSTSSVTGSESTGSTSSTGSLTESTTLDIGSYAGNVFYDDGLIVINGEISEYELIYKSTKTIYETEVSVLVKAGEFNTSQNPTTLDVSVLGEYEFVVTSPTDLTKTGSVTIKEVYDISKKEEFISSISSSVSGTWDDYDDYRLTDPTGSYIAPYITTIGLYDDNNNMVAVAKLPNPVKNLPDYDITFLIRIDI